MLNFLFRRFCRLRLLQSVSLRHLLDDLAGVGQPPLRKQRAVAPVLRLTDVLKAEQNQLLVLLLSLGVKPLDDADNLIDAPFCTDKSGRYLLAKAALYSS